MAEVRSTREKLIKKFYNHTIRARPSPSPNLGNCPLIRAARLAVTAIRLLNQVPEPLGNGPWCVMHVGSSVQTRPASISSRDSGPFEEIPMKRSFRLQRPALSGQKRTPGRAKPPESAIGVPSARQQAAPVICPSSPNAIAFMPPPTCGII